MNKFYFKNNLNLNTNELKQRIQELLICEKNKNYKSRWQLSIFIIDDLHFN